MSLDFDPMGGVRLDDKSRFECHEIVQPSITAPNPYPIPLEHRLYFLRADDLPEYYPSISDIVDELGADPEWVKTTASELEIEEADVEGEYLQYALPVLKHEYVWQQAYENEPDLVSRRKMGQMLDMPDTWVQKTLAELEYTPFRVVHGDVTEHQYVKSILQHLRAVKMSVRPAGDKVTIYELHDTTGRRCFCGRNKAVAQDTE